MLPMLYTASNSTGEGTECNRMVPGFHQEEDTKIKGQTSKILTNNLLMGKKIRLRKSMHCKLKDISV